MQRSILISTLSMTLLIAACAESGGDATTTTVGEPPVESFHPQDKGWELVWSDEFDGTSLDETKWGYEENCWGGGNQEQQCYTDRLDNTYLSDGILHIRAIEEQFTGLDGSEDWDNVDELGTATLPYTSGRIRTRGNGDWRYGRYEIRAQLPFGQGMWPAIWMLPTDSTYGGWAASGEIDIMEAVNLKTVWTPDNNAVHGTLHYGAEFPSNTNSGMFLQFFDDHPADTFHVYAVEWEEGEIRWYVDDVHYATQVADGRRGYGSVRPALPPDSQRRRRRRLARPP
jgi:beta-glucanase (GH16 family)